MDKITQKNHLGNAFHQEIESLPALDDCLFNEHLQKGIDLYSISVSQLSIRLNGMNLDIFQRLFLDLVLQKIPQNKGGCKVAPTSSVYGERESYPEKTVLTTTKERDRGYLDYKRL